MPADLQTIVQRMIDAGEPEANIAAVIQQSKQAASGPRPVDPSEPGTYWGGFRKSLSDDLKGAPAYLKNAGLGVLDTLNPKNALAAARELSPHGVNVNDAFAGYDDPNKSILRQQLEHAWGVLKTPASNARLLGQTVSGAALGEYGPAAADAAVGAVKQPLGVALTKVPNRVFGTDISLVRDPIRAGGNALIQSAEKDRLANLGVDQFGVTARGGASSGPTLSPQATATAARPGSAQPIAGSPAQSTTAGNGTIPASDVRDAFLRRLSEQENLAHNVSFGEGAVIPNGMRPSESLGPELGAALDEDRIGNQAAAAALATPEGRPAKLPLKGNVPASKSRRTPMSATPGLTTIDVEELGLNPALPIKELTPELIDKIKANRASRSSLYRATAEMDRQPQ